MYYMYLEFSSGMKEMLPEPLGILELEQMGSVRKEEGNECLLVGGLVGSIGSFLIYSLLVRFGHYTRPAEIKLSSLPIWVGGLTVVGMLVYAAICQ